MPSEFAKTLNFELDARAPQRRSVEVIDAALQEVREVLAAMAAMNLSNVNEQCWCYTHVSERTRRMVSHNDHWPICERARALHQRLTPAARDAAGER